MSYLTEISVSQLQAAMDRTDDAPATKRLITAIAYKNGVTQTELAEWYGVERKTIYNWLTRLEEDHLLESATDAPRPGRNRKLTDDQLATFRELLHESPESVGLDAQNWTPRLAQQFLRTEYGVDYSIPSCRRIMKEAGLAYQPVTSVDPGSDKTERDTEGGGERRIDGIWRPI